MESRFPFFSRQHRALYCFADSLPLCQSLLDSGARIIQLRAKQLDDRAFLELAEAMQALVRSCSEPAVLIVNDRAEIAVEIGADGVHLGQNDSDYRKVISAVSPGMIVGVSVHNTVQALEAQKAGATYVGAGAVFPTVTKSDAQLIGLDGLARIVKATRIPVVAIGGIGYDNVAQVIKAGAHYCAVISDINDSANRAVRLADLNRRINETSGGKQKKS